MVAVDDVDHTPPPGGDVSREGLRQFAAYFRDRAAETRLNVQVLVAHEDAAAGFWAMEWMHRDDFFGAPADGKRLSMRGADFFRVRPKP